MRLTEVSGRGDERENGHCELVAAVLGNRDRQL